jgi:eukaryotic-like serine/threonine-protein kinase
MEPQALIGKTLGETVKITELLAVGGMGVVYRGARGEGGEPVAVKVLLPEYVSDPNVVQRFVDEAAVVRRVEHAGLIRVFDCAVDPEVGTYIVMELLQGENVEELAARCGRLPATTVVRILRQAAACLAVTHKAGIVHRDLKPSNLYLVPDASVPGGERLKVLDFGIAKLLEGRDKIGELTKTGSSMGTPIFMAPEQGLDAKRVDQRADVYALGVIAYYLLSQRLPTPGDGMLAIYIKQKHRPVRLAEAGVSVPEALEAVVMQCLEPSREARFQSMDELLQALPDEEEIRSWPDTPLPARPAGDASSPVVAPTLAATMAATPEALADSAPTTIDKPRPPEPEPAAQRTVLGVGPAAPAPTVLGVGPAAPAPDTAPTVIETPRTPVDRESVRVTEETVIETAKPAPQLADAETVIEPAQPAPALHDAETIIKPPAGALHDAETIIKPPAPALTDAETLIKAAAEPTVPASEPAVAAPASEPAAGARRSIPAWLLLAALVVVTAAILAGVLILASGR